MVVLKGWPLDQYQYQHHSGFLQIQQAFMQKFGGGGARHQQAVLTILLGDSEMESHCCIKERNHSRTLVLGSCLGNRGWDSAKCRQRKRPCRKGDGERIKTQDKIEDDSM